MLGRPFRIVLLLLLVVVVSSCHKDHYKGFHLKPEKVKNYKHPGHQWKSRHGRPRLWKGNGYWNGTERPRTNYHFSN